MNSKLVIAIFGGLLLITVLMVVVQRTELSPETETEAEILLELPGLSDVDYGWLAVRIFQNETGGQTRYLTYWGEGEDFPSFGIGHFIWFPDGVDAPFDETFPSMVSFVSQRDVADSQLPVWMLELDSFEAPWKSKAVFDQARASVEMTELRAWLEQTRHLQARFIVSAFEQRWQNLDLPPQQKSRLTSLLQQLVGSAQGLFAVVDYYNFKGLGSNARERYQQQGWGLVQVLEAMPPLSEGDRGLVEHFRRAAASRLRLRVELSPPERNEARWLDGWLLRLDGYVTSNQPPDKEIE